MAAIDYEAEYNNRARVPEHAEIFLRWAREAENYRADTLKAGRAQLGLFLWRYAAAIRRFVPAGGGAGGRGDDTAPLAVFIHGGYWRSLDPFDVPATWRVD